MLERGGGSVGPHDDDNLGSVGSVEAPTPDSKSTAESEDQDHLNNSTSLSSPPTADHFTHHFMSSFNHPFSSSAARAAAAAALSHGSPAAAVAAAAAQMHLNGNGSHHHHHHPHLSSPGLFSSSAASSLTHSPLGSRHSLPHHSLLTPHSPMANCFGNFTPTTSSSTSSSSGGLGTPATTPTNSSTAGAHQGPPRNSPFSIDQLVGPPRPTPTYPSNHRSSSSSSMTSSMSKLLSSNSKSGSSSNGSVSVSVITQLPTPPSSTDSTTSATPTMLSVA